MYVDCARRLEIRLTRIDTHAAGDWSRRSTFRSRVRLLLREEGRLDGSTEKEERRAAIDSWIGRCAVSWVRTPSYEEAKAVLLDLLGDRRPKLHVWRPRYGEDQWLLNYIERLGGRAQAGKFYVEVPIGGVGEYGAGARTRFIDAVRLPDVRPGGVFYYHRQHFEQDLAGQPVEVIEVKKSLNRTVIGQLVVARDLASAEWPPHDSLRLVALCTRGDPALEWICDERDIDVELVARHA